MRRARPRLLCRRKRRPAVRDKGSSKRITVRPGKANGLIGGIAGIIFLLIGIFVVIPVFGRFGILWTAMAVAITVGNLFLAFGKKYAGPEIRIEDEAETPEARLERLRELYERRLISQEEYEQKRAEVLQQL